MSQPATHTFDETTCPHLELVKRVLSDAQFYSSLKGLEQVTLSVPINATDSMSIIIDLDTSQIVIDVKISGRIEYSSITAADMRAPMCPVFKH